MAKNARLYPKPSLADLREGLKHYFYSILRDEDCLLCDAEQLESKLVEMQTKFFLPFFEDRDQEEFLKRLADDHLPKAQRKSIKLKLVGIRAAARQAKVRLVASHYRAVGLPKLRASTYHALEGYKNALGDAWGSGSNFSPTAHFARMFELYESVFENQETINQQVFNSHHPPGPIGLIYPNGAEAWDNARGSSSHAVFDLRGILSGSWGSVEESICTALARPVHEELLPYTYSADKLNEEERNALRRIKISLEEQRVAIGKDLSAFIRKSSTLAAQWDQLLSFFDRGFPFNADLTSARRDDDPKSILTFLQCYYLYERHAGPCVYTFPAGIQPDLPTCGWTITSEKPLNHSTLEKLQRVSETVFGELFGYEVSRRYRQSLTRSVTLLKKRAHDPLPILFDPGAEFVLGAALADTPIPLDGVISFLSFVAETVKSSVYEGKRYGFAMALIHQEFLERFVEKVEARSDDTRAPEEFFGSDAVTQGVAAAGMRINARERASGEYVNFFVYPPFNTTILDVSGFFPRLSEGLDDVKEVLNRRESITKLLDQFPPGAKTEFALLSDISNRQAIALARTVKLVSLSRSPQLQSAYARVSYTDLDTKPDSIATALTTGNREILMVLVDDSTERLKLYHDGYIILESRSTRWELPQRAGDFPEVLAGRVRRFLSPTDHQSQSSGDKKDRIDGDEQDPNTGAKELAREVTRFLQRQSKSGHGAFLVFHPEQRPESWQDLDVLNARATRKGAEKLTFDDDDNEWSNNKALEETLGDYSEVDGAIVISRPPDGNGKPQLCIEPRILITTAPFLERKQEELFPREFENGEDSEKDKDMYSGYVEKRLRQTKAMKGLQARFEHPKLRSVGTKHTSAYEYALLVKHGFAIVVSEDGPVSLFYCEVEEDLERFRQRYENAEILSERGLLDGWNRRVNIVTM